jgi:hypothetical protein
MKSKGGRSPLVLPGIPLQRRANVLGSVCVLAVVAGLFVEVLLAADTVWVQQSSIAGGVIDSELAENQPDNDCEDYINIPGGLGPGWARVGGDPNPHAPIISVAGQVLDPHDYVNFSGGDSLPASRKTNAFVTHTDNTLNHFARDVNVFLTLDPEDRHNLSTGSFVEGDSNEHGHFEVEWERGGIPMYAFPAIGDRMRVWGPLIFDCGHGDTWVEVGPDDDDTYRTEIHPAYGWVIYRHTADANGQPDGGKENESPWQWYHTTDLQGQAAALPSSGLLFTKVQATVADAYFSSYGGNAVEALNGCDDADDPALPCYDYPDRPELSGNEDIDSWEWANPVLDHDYAFVVPAPPRPSGSPLDVQMIWDVEDRCSEVPPNPTFPNKNHPESVDEVEGMDPLNVYSSDRPIGNATCNPANAGQFPFTIEADPDETAPWNNTGRPAIRFTVRARTGHDGIDGNADDPTYPSNDYISFAYRVKVAWDYAPNLANRARTIQVDFDTLYVYNDGEGCDDEVNIDLESGEWIMSLRVNDQYIHPVEGSAPDDNDDDDNPEPFWETGVMEDERCGGDEGTGRAFNMGSNGASYLTRQITVLPGQPIEVWERAYDKDDVSSDDLSATIRHFLGQPPIGGSSTHVIGSTNVNNEMAHTIELILTDVTPETPVTGTLSFGSPQYGPNSDTFGRIRVSGETPVTFVGPSNATGFEWRLWPVDTTPGPWQFDFELSDGLTLDLPDDISCVCIIEWATITGTGIGAVVSERTRQTIELDNEPPELFVPDDFSVYANQTAGAKVVYTVTATDNFPGPIDIDCAPPSGDIFPNGKNAPQVTTVDCTATDTVENQSSDAFDVTVISPHGYVNDYALLGTEWMDIGQAGLVNTGSVGVFAESGGIPGQAGLELRFGNDGRTMAGAAIAGHSVRLGADLQVGEVFSVTPLVAGADSVVVSYPPCDPNAPASLEKCSYVPLWAGLPAFVPPGPPGPDRSFKGSPNVLAPGNYGELELKSNAVLTLQPGAYSFTSVHLQPGARVIYGLPAPTVRVAGRVVVKSHASIEPTGGAPSRLGLYVAGSDAPPNKPAFDMGPGSKVFANVYVPNGTFDASNNPMLSGAFIGRWMKLGSGVPVTKDSIFILP